MSRFHIFARVGVPLRLSLHFLRHILIRPTTNGLRDFCGGH